MNNGDSEKSQYLLSAFCVLSTMLLVLHESCKYFYHYFVVEERGSRESCDLPPVIIVQVGFTRTAALLALRSFW
jgi:hypothetical protein